MKLSGAAFFLVSLIASVSCLGAMSDVNHPSDSTVHATDTLKGKYPYLWDRIKKSVNLFPGRIKTARHTESTLDTGAIIAEEIKKQTKDNAQRAAEMNEKMKFEDFYVDNKPGIDVARGKFVLNPYLANYVYFDQIDDPAPNLAPRPRRWALKWQISVQIPVLIAKFANTGIFFAFTNRCTFDLLNPTDSRPVTHKTFMPEGFGRFDLASLVSGAGIDKYVLQVGAQHESNGGVDDSLSLFDSRGIMAKVYAQVCTKFMKAPADSNYRYLMGDRYKLVIGARMFKCYDVADNPDIVKYIGYLDLNASYEFAPIVSIFNHEHSIGVFLIDGFFAPGGSVKPWHTSYAICLSYTLPMLSNKNVYYPYLPRLPVTPYVRFFRGYNEFLFTYNKPTTVIGFGLRLRN
jgi:outer membrane phospholipase A